MNSVGIAPIRRVWNAASDLQAQGKTLTLQAIADRAGLAAKSTAMYHLWNLWDAGIVEWDAGKSSTLRVLIPLYTMTPQQAEVVKQWEGRKQQAASSAAM